jgi:hypothetical protein
MIGQQPDGTFIIEKSEQKKRLSNSQIETLTKCGEQYRQRYVLHHRSPAGISLFVGSAVDKGVTQNLDKKIMLGSLMSNEELEQIVRTAYRSAVREAKEGDEGILLKKDEAEMGLEEAIADGEAKAVRLALLHARDVAPSLNPIALQRPIGIELPGYPFDIGGILDIQEADSVRDTKTKGTTPPKDTAHRDDQLTIYAMLVFLADGAIPQKLILDCLVDLKTPKYVPLESTRTEEDFNVLLRRIAIACEAIDSGIFLPAPETDWWCSEYSCGFWQNCKYVKRSRRPAA